MGACFPASILFSIYFEGDHPTVFCVSVSWYMCWVVGRCEIVYVSDISPAAEMDVYMFVCACVAFLEYLKMSIPVLRIYSKHKKIPAALCILHTIISLSNVLFSCTRILFCTLSLMMLCWYICKNESHYFFVKHFLLAGIESNFSQIFPFPLCPVWPFLQTLFQYYTALLASGMVLCSTVLCQRAADWPLTWIIQHVSADLKNNVQISIDYWLWNLGCSVCSEHCCVARHCVFGCDHVTLCSVWECERSEKENRQQKVLVSFSLLCVFAIYLPIVRFSIFSQAVNLSQCKLLCLTLERISYGSVAVTGVWLITGSQDVGTFRWYFITLASPLLIKSRPTQRLCCVTSSITICICLWSIYCKRMFAQHLLILLTWTTHTHTSSSRHKMRGEQKHLLLSCSYANLKAK